MNVFKWEQEIKLIPFPNLFFFFFKSNKTNKTKTLYSILQFYLRVQKTELKTLEPRYYKDSIRSLFYSLATQ